MSWPPIKVALRLLVLLVLPTETFLNVLADLLHVGTTPLVCQVPWGRLT
jgi:hypothetical protein